MPLPELPPSQVTETVPPTGVSLLTQPVAQNLNSFRYGLVVVNGGELEPLYAYQYT